MKKFLCVLLAVLLIGFVFAGCNNDDDHSDKNSNDGNVEDDKLITIVVEEEYIDDFADAYAVKKTTSLNGVKYKFKEKAYEKFISDYHEEVKNQSQLLLISVWTYSYYNLDSSEIIVGLADGEYEKRGEDALKEEAQAIGQASLQYDAYQLEPDGKVDVTYRNANTADEYFTITCEF